MNCKRLLTLFFLFCTMFTAETCKKNTVIQPPDDTQPGRRDYVWTVDTLKLSQYDLFTPTRIWGSAPNNVWITGFGDVSWNLLWHYDGVSWKKDSAQRIISPSALFGFAKNDVWLGNTNNTIWHYNGTIWDKFGEYKLAGYSHLSIVGLWGNSPNDVFAVGAVDNYDNGGFMGAIMHFDGISWTFLEISLQKILFTDIRQDMKMGLLFLEGTRFESTGDTNKAFILRDRLTQEIHSGINPMKIEEVNKEVYFVVGKKIYRYNNNQLLLWKDFSTTNFVGRMVGRSEKDFFCTTTDGIAHFNGTDLLTLFKTNLDFLNVTVIDTDVFFACKNFSTGSNVVIHGKLKE